MQSIHPQTPTGILSDQSQVTRRAAREQLAADHRRLALL